MGLRGRLALLFGGVVALVVVIVLVASQALASRSLEQAIDDELTDRAEFLSGEDSPVPLLGRRGGFAGRGRPNAGEADRLSALVGSVQFIARDGSTFGSDIPIDGDILARARVSGVRVFSNQTDDDGARLRVLTFAVEDEGPVLQLAERTTSIDEGLEALRRILIPVGLAGVALAATLGWWLATRFTGPIRSVTAATRSLASGAAIAGAPELPERLAVDRDDEIGELAASFNQMLDALGESRSQQERLVADASHELRTPLTSLRMKIDFLAREPGLSPDDRAPILSSAAGELESLSELVTELVDLARWSSSEEPVGDVALGPLLESLVERFRQRTGRRVELTVDTTQVRGRPRMIQRAVSNLLDNAHKYSPSDAPVTVVSERGRIEVRDRGDGIAPAERSLAFERFWRADTARTRPGSGIGLAIVKRCAEIHNGDVWIDDAPDGGAAVGLALPPVPSGSSAEPVPPATQATAPR